MPLNDQSWCLLRIQPDTKYNDGIHSSSHPTILIRYLGVSKMTEGWVPDWKRAFKPCLLWPDPEMAPHRISQWL